MNENKPSLSSITAAPPTLGWASENKPCGLYSVLNGNCNLIPCKAS